MKVFVSGQIGDVDRVRVVQDALRRAGHEITHDWTRNETGKKMLSSRADKLNNPEEATRRATLDIDGVLDADAYVICSDNEDAGKGMYVELGAAIAMAERGSMRVYLLGGMNHMTIFYFHPKVQKIDSIEELLEELGVRA